MRHEMRLGGFALDAAAMAEAVESCVHCGFCLATCPTYQVLGQEMDSPRGRIVLMKGALEGSFPFSDVLPHLDLCLGCQACVTACPSGVRYERLLMPVRNRIRTSAARPFLRRVLRLALLQVLPNPRRFAVAARMGIFARPLHSLVPRPMRPALDLLPSTIPPRRRLPATYPADGRRRARVALLEGCIQQVLAPDVNWATIRVLARNGVEVVVPRGQGCCGALALHLGEEDAARKQAGRNLQVFPRDVDAVISNAAGCGSALREYGVLFAGRPQQSEATAFSDHARDVSQFLDELGIEAPPGLSVPTRVAYHDACHLAHAQGVRAAPRRLLAQIDNLALVEIPDADICCGSAGVYNLEQPGIARELGVKKATRVAGLEADALALGNIGCMAQIRTHLSQLGSDIPVLHTVEVLDRAYRRLPLRATAAS